MKELLKWPLIIAAVVVVLRVVTEQAGAPDSINNLISVVALHLLIGPLYFAIQVARSGEPRPYVTLFKLVLSYVVLTRVMVLPTYWLARIYEWPQPRFAGLSGPDVTPFTGYIAIPFMTGAIWVVMSVIFGGLAGSVVVAILRRASKPGAAGLSSAP